MTATVSSERPSRRVVRLASVCVLGVGLLAATWWFLWIPNHRPALEPGEAYGIDVSAHQDSIDWQRVAADEIDFAYIKATEGGDFVDERFEANWAGASQTGLKRGAYHFFTLCTPGDVQAENFLRVAAPNPEALAPAVDLELAGNCSDRPPRGDLMDELNAFLTPVEVAWGRQVVLYVGTDWEGVYPVMGHLGRPLWLRRFLLKPDRPWHIWQLHGYADVDGIEGGVDLNVMEDF